MNYRPRAPHRLWDTWLFPWENRYHLFYLETQMEGCWDFVGRAVSDDLIHWKRLPSIPTTGPAGAWNEGPMALTGMTLEHEGTFYMFLGSVSNELQVVGLFLSDDLEHWTEAPANPVIRPDPEWYHTACGEQEIPWLDWRDPQVFRSKDDDCWYALVCARARLHSDDSTGAAIARLRSDDLLHWEAMPPLVEMGESLICMEVPDYFKLNGRHYLLYSCTDFGGIVLDTPARDNAGGTWYLTADSFEGPWTAPAEPLLIGASDARMGAYVGRTIPWRDGRLLYHHIRSDYPAFALPKFLTTRADGALELRYLPELDGLETGLLREGFADDAPTRTRGLGSWRLSDGALIGHGRGAGSSCTMLYEVGDCSAQVTLNVRSARRAGVVLRMEGTAGVGVTLDFTDGELTVGPIWSTPIGYGAGIGECIFNMAGRVPPDRCRLGLERGRDIRLRVLARAEFFEVYLDDVWASTYPLPSAAESGRLDLFVNGGEAIFSGLRIAELEPMPR